MVDVARAALGTGRWWGWTWIVGVAALSLVLALGAASLLTATPASASSTVGFHIAHLTTNDIRLTDGTTGIGGRSSV